MTSEVHMNTDAARGLDADDSSVRLRAALEAGTEPDPGLLEMLIERCAVEPDFFVRDMLSWALLRLPPETTLPRIRRELGSERAQARSQALHTLSKIGDVRTWPWITTDLLRDDDDEVARTAWRAAVVLVVDDDREDLIAELVRQLGRGERDMQLSLSRALIDVGGPVESALDVATSSSDPAVATHARATVLLLQSPEIGFDTAIDEAKRVVALGPE
jgi:HEAT repeat protein